ncbi:hypothetical protein C8J95_103361 [Elizabethkingia sp. YR214]|nr:hypothetical protein [Elizabethkingia sp. YR214]PUB33761.1 hypothetical protein C8J95_103361 [Elizabethkingia sp. YR214]
MARKPGKGKIKINEHLSIVDELVGELHFSKREMNEQASACKDFI